MNIVGLTENVFVAKQTELYECDNQNILANCGKKEVSYHLQAIKMIMPIVIWPLVIARQRSYRISGDYSNERERSFAHEVP